MSLTWPPCLSSLLLLLHLVMRLSSKCICDAHNLKANRNNILMSRHLLSQVDPSVKLPLGTFPQIREKGEQESELKQKDKAIRTVVEDLLKEIQKKAKELKPEEAVRTVVEYLIKEMQKKEKELKLKEKAISRTVLEDLIKELQKKENDFKPEGEAISWTVLEDLIKELQKKENEFKLEEEAIRTVVEDLIKELLKMEKELKPEKAMKTAVKDLIHEMKMMKIKLQVEEEPQAMKTAVKDPIEEMKMMKIKLETEEEPQVEKGLAYYEWMLEKFEGYLQRQPREGTTVSQQLQQVKLQQVKGLLTDVKELEKSEAKRKNLSKLKDTKGDPKVSFELTVCRKTCLGKLQHVLEAAEKLEIEPN